MSLRTSDEIQEFLRAYNWNDNDGVKKVEYLLDEPNCEFGNALLFYWLIEGPSYYSERYEGHKHKELLLQLERRLLNGFYRKGRIRYLPVEEERLFKTQTYLLKKNGLPEELIEPSYP